MTADRASGRHDFPPKKLLLLRKSFGAMTGDTWEQAFEAAVLLRNVTEDDGRIVEEKVTCFMLMLDGQGNSISSSCWQVYENIPVAPPQNVS
mmetsp:Transcript_6056/g.10426  ORF Transcript_6056/g.10426 Transcript_6056/m.10426 type:complete len:92 (-) Transcript_6056:24-299(-)